MSITRGEWKVFENPDGLGEDKGSITIEADGVVIARVNSHIPEAMANARLMVASKEMYEALKAILNEPDFGLPVKLFVLANKAQVKAEGGKHVNCVPVYGRKEEKK